MKIRLQHYLVIHMIETILSYELHGDFRIRRLTPTECSRLQTVPDWYKWECSETQQYKMLGNGWTIKVIEHILKRIKES